MTKRRAVRIVFKVVPLYSAIVLFGAPAWAQVSLQNISPTPHAAPPGTSVGDIGAAIAEAANRLGWRVDSHEPGESIASILVRGRHLAVVRIGYDEAEFWIEYVSSENLEYSERDFRPTFKGGRTIKGPRIHRNYNRWVENLANQIRIEMQNPPDSTKIHAFATRVRL